MKNFAFLVLLVASLSACKNDKPADASAEATTSPSVQVTPPATSPEAVVETPGATTSNADVVRNPATASAAPIDPAKASKIEFAEKVYDFGTVKQGKVVEHSFKFKNTGKVPLIISDARSTCGCTVPEWPKEPIAPGATGEITAKFNTEGKSNNQEKVITITANTIPNETTVTVKGFVDAPVAKQPEPAAKAN